MEFSEDIVLRPRFKKELMRSNQSALEAFENQKATQDNFIVSRVNNHVFIRIVKQKQHFWSPQLHLEILPVSDNQSMLHGLFGPNPTIWTLFMFVHFIVAGLFIALGVWAYTNWRLKAPFSFQIAGMGLMVLVWFLLYFGGRMGRHAGKAQMHELHAFMNKVLNL